MPARQARPAARRRPAPGGTARPPPAVSRPCSTTCPAPRMKPSSTRYSRRWAYSRRKMASPAPPCLRPSIDPLPRRRQAAAEAWAGTAGRRAGRPCTSCCATPTRGCGCASPCPAAGGDRTAVPELIHVLGELPSEQAGPAEEALRLLAGRRARKRRPATTPRCGTSTATPGRPGGRSSPRRPSGLAARGQSAGLGYTLLVEVGGNGNGRVARSRARARCWTVEGLNFPVDAWVLGGNRILVAEYNGNRVTRAT